MRAAIYTRISKEDQSIYSIATQVDACRALGIQESYDVVEIFTDDGYSSERLDCPGLEAVRDLVCSRAIDAYIVYSPDRLTRKLGHMLILVDECVRHGVKLLFVTDPHDESPSGKLMQHIKSALSEYELEVIKERVMRGQKARIKDGILSLGRGIPYGYDWVPVGPNSRGELVINVNEASVVREVYLWRIQGYGSYRIARLLSLRGIPTKRGHKYWCPKVVIGILTNQAYIGTMFYGRLTKIIPTKRNKPVGKYLKTASQKNSRDH
jgi:site-specific DNA recombinase